MATSAFTKFDPRAFLESEPRTGAAAKPANPAKVDDDRAPTLAALATLAGAPAEIHDPRPTDNVWTDAQEERAAIVEHDGGMRRPWAEAMARLDPARVPANMSQERWAQFIDDCGRFLDQGWATHAEGLGWGPLDLFGCDRERSPAEGDHAGLLWRIEGGKLIIMSAYAAIIETATGQQKTFHRRNNRPGELALAWELDQDRGLSGNRHPSTGD